MTQRRLSYIYIPITFFQLDISSLLEMSLLALIAGFGDKGLIMSNSDIATELNRDRRNVVRAITRLKRKRLIKDVGKSDRKRCLVAVKDKILDDNNIPAKEVKCPQIGGATAIQKGNRRKAKTTSYSDSPVGSTNQSTSESKYGTYPATPSIIQELKEGGFL